MKYLIVPGLNGSGPEHWQTRWEQSNTTAFARVEQHNWELPDRDLWISTLNRYIENIDERILLVAHSLGCVTVAHWARQFNTDKVAGALLVAPADVERSNKAVFNTFRPVPDTPLPFGTIVVASGDDQYASIERSGQLAEAWQATLVDVGFKGHINAQSNLGFWDEGFQIMKDLEKAISAFPGSLSEQKKLSQVSVTVR